MHVLAMLVTSEMEGSREKLSSLTGHMRPTDRGQVIEVQIPYLKVMDTGHLLPYEIDSLNELITRSGKIFGRNVCTCVGNVIFGSAKVVEIVNGKRIAH